MIPFYLDGDNWVLGHEYVPAGTHRMDIEGDLIHISTIEGKLVYVSEYNKFTDINDVAYSSLSEFKNAVLLFFVKPPLLTGVENRLDTIEDVTFKVAYYEPITNVSGQISIPEGCTILLDQWANGVDAILSAIQNGKPDYVDTYLDCTLDINGNYTVSGALPTNPSALIYYLEVPILKLNTLSYNRFADDTVLLNVRPTFDYTIFNTAYAGLANQLGKVCWNNTEHTLDIGVLNGSILSVGQEMYILVRNTTGATITDGTAVYYNGTTGNSGRILIGKYIANNTISSDLFLGLTTHDIPNNSDGLVTVFGKVRGFNSAGYSDGNTLYCSTTVAGNLTNVVPTAPNNVVEVGYVVHAHSNGTIFINPRHNPKFKDLQDVNGTPLTTSGQIAVWNQTNGYFDFTENINNYVKSLSQIKVDTLVFNKAQGKGILVDTDSPTYPWEDLIGDIVPKETGVGSPTLDTFRSPIRAFRYSVNDTGDLTYHIPHDWLLNSQAYIHVHWGHNGTAISGTFAIRFDMIYADRTLNNPAKTFSTVRTLTLTVGSLNITNSPQYCHRVDEIQFTSVGGSASTIDSSDIEVDGIIEMSYTVTSIPTITGGVGNEPYFFTIDVHYQSTGIGTKSKDPDFYT